MSMQWNIVWQVDPSNLASCIERDWFNEMISLVPIDSIRIDYDAKPLLQTIMPCSIVCASCPNQTTAEELIRYLRKVPQPKVLYHASDEYAKVGDAVYQHCDLVIRNGSLNPDVVDRSRVIQIPLGFATGLCNQWRELRRSSQRKCSCTFLGTIKHERATEMLSALDAVAGPHFIRKTGSFADATRHFGNSTIAIYKNSIFVPAPKGNWSPECNRLYDALEWACIPLIKRYDDTEYHATYYENLFGKHPLPVFNAWKEAAEFANDLLSKKEALDSLQAEVFAWWQGYKSELKNTISNRLAKLADSDRALRTERVALRLDQ